MTTNKLKRPCAVELDGLSKKQAIELQELFLEDGANLDDDVANFTITIWRYFGIASEGGTFLYNNLGSYGETGDEVPLRTCGEVTLYTYDEVVSIMGCNDDTTISDVQATKVPPEGDNGSESNTDSFKVICNKIYTITIKGQEFVLTEAEYVELEEAMRLVDE